MPKFLSTEYIVLHGMSVFTSATLC